MINRQNSLLNVKKSKSFLVLAILGVILNLLALITDGNRGALVAVGCSLIVIGIASSKR